MKVAVTYENGQVFQHFGHTENFKIYDVENGKIIKSEVYNTNGSGHGALAGFLKEYKVNVLICGGIGEGAQNALVDLGIKFFGGVTGAADEVVEAFLKDKLDFDPNIKCNHHEKKEDHGACGEHGCGKHN